MRILFSLLDASIGGGQRVAFSVAQELRARGHSLGVLSPSTGPATEEFESLGAVYHSAEVGSLRGAADVTRVVTAMRDYDLLYSHTSIPGQVLGDVAVRASGRAHVIHQHTVPRVSPRAVVGATHRVLYRATVARRRIITVAPHVRDAALALGARAERVAVVPNGVDVESLRRTADQVSDHDGIRVGMLARFDPQKGFDVFLATASALRDAGAEFVIGASGAAYPEYERHIRAEAQAAGVRVIDPGRSATSFLAGLDIVVMPSLRPEGSPLTLLESMGLGKAVVASDIDGIGTIPAVDEAMTLVPAGDAPATAAAVRSLIDDFAARSSLGSRAAMFVEERHREGDSARAAADIVEQSSN